MVLFIKQKNIKMEQTHLRGILDKGLYLNTSLFKHKVKYTAYFVRPYVCMYACIYECMSVHCPKHTSADLLQTFYCLHAEHI